MALLWVTLLLLHQGHSLVPVVTVQLGEPVTFSCAFTEKFKSTTWIYWYKQIAGETLKVILMQRENFQPNYEPGFSSKRFSITTDKKICNLTILKTVQQDEGMYHCAYTDWTKSIWTGTYLSIKGDTEKTSNYAVVHQSMVSDPTRPAASETLQCSVLSEPQNKTCSGDLSVFWFRSRSDQSYPDVIYTDGNRPDKCDETSDTQRRCSYNFSKNISSSESGTYYCAVATCGQILFTKGTKLQRDRTSSSQIIVLMVILIFLVISVTANIVFVWYQIHGSVCKRENSTLQARRHNLRQAEAEDGQDLNYAALRFSGGKRTREKKNKELRMEESVYSQVKGSV